MKSLVSTLSTSLLVALAAAGPARAAEPAEAPPPAPAAAAAPERPAPGAGALRVILDPATGQAVAEPSAAQARELAAAGLPADLLSTSGAGLSVIRLEDGTGLLRLEGRFANVLFATVGPGGVTTVGHEMPADLAAALPPTAVPAPAPEAP